MIKVENLSFSYNDRPLYEGVSLIISKGQKIGLVGINGSGKSTLLKILTGKEEGYKGKVFVTGTIGLVPQEVKVDPEMEASETVKQYVDPNNNYQEYQINKMFSGLELSLLLSQKPQNLSGGQKTKLALAKALLANPDTLFLDEPTNFMDIGGRKWVMNFLSNYQGTVVVISHDLELMDNEINKVLFINTAKREIEEYKGNYSSFIRLKKEREELLKRQIVVKEKHIKQMEKGLSKMVRFTSKKGVRQRVRQQRRIEKEKTLLPELPKEVKKIKMNLPDPPKVGEIPVKAIDIKKSYGDLEVLNNLTFTVVRGERLALIGPNGSGKSTLIKILMEIINADFGNVIKSDLLKTGYYSQEFETFDFTKTVINTFVDQTKKDIGFARSYLGKFMFFDGKIFQKVESLSGGEKTRLSIAILTAQGNNLLILDEPTTYLDVTSQRVILEALKEYKGTMIVVSHTPEFIKELKPDKALLFPEQKMVFWDEHLVDKVANI
jgi:ATP-binding cassette, subfamily F, member 3